MMPPNGMPPPGMQPPVPMQPPGGIPQAPPQPGQQPIDPAMLAQMLMAQGQGMQGMPAGANTGQPGGMPGAQMPPQGMPQPPMMGPGGPAGALRRY